jgi:hypothetical protein
MRISERRKSVRNLWDGFIRRLGKVLHTSLFAPRMPWRTSLPKPSSGGSCFAQRNRPTFACPRQKTSTGGITLRPNGCMKCVKKSRSAGDSANASRLPQEDIAFYSNPLVVGHKTPGIGRLPSMRVLGQRPDSFTFEFDEPALDFFRRQLSWCRVRPNGHNWRDSAIGDLYAALAGYQYHSPRLPRRMELHHRAELILRSSD